MSQATKGLTPIEHLQHEKQFFGHQAAMFLSNFKTSNKLHNKMIKAGLDSEILHKSKENLKLTKTLSQEAVRNGQLASERLKILKSKN